MNPDFRRRSLELQQTAVEALLKAAPERAEPGPSLELLASPGWPRPSISRMYDTSTSLGPDHAARLVRQPLLRQPATSRCRSK